MDGAVHIGQIAQLVMYARKLLCIGQQPLHLCLRAAVAELEVVQHGIVLLRKALIGILDGCHVSAHLVSVVRHVHHGHVGQLRSGVCVLTHAGQQTGGKAGGLLHVFVGGQTHRPVRLCGIVKNSLLGLHQRCIFVFDGIHRFAHGLGIFFYAASARTEQRFDAADALL